MPDITASLTAGALNPWLLLPLAVVLGALHALEPGHAKSLMAAFIIAIRGTIGDAILLGLSAAAGHSVVVWVLALIGWSLGDSAILPKAEPYLIMASGVLVLVLAVRMLLQLSGGLSHGHSHGHSHDHGHDHGAEVEQRFAGRHVTKAEIIWFGITGGLLPCPSAIAVLLICWQIKATTLGVFMVLAFSLGLAIALVAVGVAAAWGVAKAGARLDMGGGWLRYAPHVSSGIVLLLGIGMTVRGAMML